MANIFIGPIAGTLVAGGVYYGFSNLITTRTSSISADLHTLSHRLLGAQTIVPASPPAASLVDNKAFSSLIHESWNRQTASLVQNMLDFDIMSIPAKARKAWDNTQSRSSSS